MCGIHVVISRRPPPAGAEHDADDPITTPTTTEANSYSLDPDLARRLRARGPDHFGQVGRCASGVTGRTADTQPAVGDTTGDSSDPRGGNPRAKGNGDADGGWSLRFTSTVLALRGDHVARQPLVRAGDGARGDVLCWNGEAWRVGGRPVEGNDGEAVFARLTAAAAASAAGLRAVAGNSAGAGAGGVDAVLDVLRSVEGPFAFVFYDAVGGRVFFGRDRLGRRSLLTAPLAGGGMVLCSVAGRGEDGWKEVEADGLYVVRLSDGGAGAAPERYDWIAGEGAVDFVSGIGRFNKALPSGTCALTVGSPSVSVLRQQLLESLRLRVLGIPSPPALGPNGKTRVAVLFSGGLDCTVLARLCHELLEPDQVIDLLNVAFENPRVAAQLRKQIGHPPDIYEACPDRITGRRSSAELQSVCPGRAFRFVAVNVPYTETLAHRQQVVSLIYPHNTEMDLSIAYALYFSARGEGLSTESGSPGAAVPYTSPARVLLSGLGADELFGGYTRHSSAFQQRGYAGVINELLLDVGRLGKRNLGRDDRVMAHWGKEVRFPYLDERLVKWATETPAWEKCDFENSEDVSGVEAGKRILRLLASELGMQGVAKEKKRAIQFGSRTAKMESGRVKGTTLIS